MILYEASWKCHNIGCEYWGTLSLCPFLRNVTQWKGSDEEVERLWENLKFAIVEINENTKNKETMFLKLKNGMNSGMQ